MKVYSSSNEIGHKPARQVPLVQKQVSVCFMHTLFLMYNTSMNENFFQEFSDIYCRLMRLEILMKKKLISSLLGYYKEDVINEFDKFFYNKTRMKRYDNKTGNGFLSILKNPQITKDSKKLIKIINIMYLSDVLFIVLCCEQFRKQEIIEKFYTNIPEKYGNLIKNRQILLDLRNTIAHYNIRDYVQNKTTYLEVLNIFEKHIL